MSKWPTVRLGDVVDIERVIVNGHFAPYVGLEDIESGTGRLIGETSPRRVKSSTFMFDESHVLYGRLRPYLNKWAIPREAGHCSTEIFPLKPAGPIMREYLAFWLSSGNVCERINDTSRGARMPRANMDAVLDFQIPLPPLNEQKRIVAKLNEVECNVQDLGRRLAKKASLLQRVPAQSLERLIEAQPSTTTIRLGDLLRIEHGFAFRSEWFTSSGSLEVLTPGHFIDSGGFRDRGDKRKFYSGEFPSRFMLSRGELLVAMTEQAEGLLGAPLLVPDTGTYLHNQRLGKVSPIQPMSLAFLFWLFTLDSVRSQIGREATGVKVRHTSPSKIEALEVRMPRDVAEQQRVAEAMDEISNQIARHQVLTEQITTLTGDFRRVSSTRILDGAA